MATKRWLGASVAAGVILLFLGGSRLMPNQEVSRCAPAAKLTEQTSAPSAFCPFRSAGELCPHRTAALLNVKGEKQLRWNGALQNYNRAIESAQRQLIQETQKFMSPVEVEQVKAWFVANDSRRSSTQP